jgi:Fe-S cluster biogenesis protein NfuA
VLDAAAVGSALVEVRELIRADGGDITLSSIDATTGAVTLRLVLDGAVCRECVMPKPILEAIAADVLRASVPDVRSVSIDDPRADAVGEA